MYYSITSTVRPSAPAGRPAPEIREDLLLMKEDEELWNYLCACEEEVDRETAKKQNAQKRTATPMDMYLQFVTECPLIADIVLDWLFDWCKKNNCHQFDFIFDLEK